MEAADAMCTEDFTITLPNGAQPQDVTRFVIVAGKPEVRVPLGHGDGPGAVPQWWGTTLVPEAHNSLTNTIRLMLTAVVKCSSRSISHAMQIVEFRNRWAQLWALGGISLQTILVDAAGDAGDSGEAS